MGYSFPVIVTVISADAEWQATCRHFDLAQIEHSPLGEWFVEPVSVGDRTQTVVFFHGGWGKIAAAAAAQYIIDRWQPSLLVNLGTCGGIDGYIDRGDVVLVERTLVYDIFEQMGDSDEHIDHYAVEIDLSWLGSDYPHPVVRGLLVSADRDLMVEDLSMLQSRYGAVAADWESGAIAYVSAINKTPCLILRGVTDLVGQHGGEAYDGSSQFFSQATDRMMSALLAALPAWLERVSKVRGLGG